MSIGGKSLVIDRVTFSSKFTRCVLQSPALSAMNNVIMYKLKQILIKFYGQNEETEILVDFMV
jgi:hypothetical protein